MVVVLVKFAVELTVVSSTLELINSQFLPGQELTPPSYSD
jgi:hypothetical protein